MKKRFLILLSAWVLAMTAAFAQDDVSAKLTSALARGEVAELEVVFSEQMEVSGIGAPGIYSPRQMASVLASFFAENSPRSCRVSHQGTRENTSFYVLSMLDANDREYRVYVLMKRVGDKPYIKQFRIDHVKK